MVRRNFLQVLQEKNVDLKREYQRLYELFYIQKAPDMQGICYTLKDFCEGNFLNVPFRRTCLSLEDFDDTYNYHFEKIPHDFDLNYLLSFCEYTFNLSIWITPGNPLCVFGNAQQSQFYLQQVQNVMETSVYKGYKRDKIEMRGDRAEMSDFPLYLNTVAGGLDRRDQTIGGFSFVVKIYAVPVVEIIG